MAFPVVCVCSGGRGVIRSVDAGVTCGVSMCVYVCMCGLCVCMRGCVCVCTYMYGYDRVCK